MIEKNVIGIDSEKAKERVPKIVVFLIIILPGYPNVFPEVLTKSNFCMPSLMDGRDLLNEICPTWNVKSGLKPIFEGILPFLSRVINAKGYKFYGMFHLGSTYNLKTACAVMNGANEAAVAKFLADEIGFYDIPRLVRKAMDAVPFVEKPSLEQILEADRLARAAVEHAE